MKKTTASITMSWGFSDTERKSIRYDLDESLPVKPATEKEIREWIRHQIDLALDRMTAHVPGVCYLPDHSECTHE